MDTSDRGRRDFLKSLALGAAGAAMLSPQSAQAAAGGTLQVWSCGGLAEAMMPAHAAYAQQSGVKIVYTGAFAAALGKSLLTGGGQTEVQPGPAAPCRSRQPGPASAKPAGPQYH